MLQENLEEAEFVHSAGDNQAAFYHGREHKNQGKRENTARDERRNSHQVH
jgi:hypothetical protein